jgi:hypothetical protein
MEYFSPAFHKKVLSEERTRQVFIFELTTQKFRRFALPYFDSG